MARFDNKNFVITGGSSGIGLATALVIAQEGGGALVTGSNPDKLKEAAAAHPNIHTLLNDAGDPAEADRLAAEAKRLFGQIDGVFLNAGKGGGAPLGQITPAIFQEFFNLNVGGPLFGAQALAPIIKDGGSIVITASAAKDKGMAGAAVYSATKGAVRSMTKALARELAPRRIRVNTLSPGPIETPFFERLGRPAEVLEKLAGMIRATNPMGRFGTPEEAAAVALFLLSDQSTFVTGSDYAVDGGEAQL